MAQVIFILFLTAGLLADYHKYKTKRLLNIALRGLTTT